MGLRSSRTTTRPTLKTIAARTNNDCSSTVMAEPLDQALQFGDIFLAELARLGEVGHEGRHPSAEQPVEQTLALAVHIVGAFELGTVEITLAVALGGDGAFLEQ